MITKTVQALNPNSNTRVTSDQYNTCGCFFTVRQPYVVDEFAFNGHSFDEQHCESSALSIVLLNIKKCETNIEASLGTGPGEENNVCAIERQRSYGRN